MGNQLKPEKKKKPGVPSVNMAGKSTINPGVDGKIIYQWDIFHYKPTRGVRALISKWITSPHFSMRYCT